MINPAPPITRCNRVAATLASLAAVAALVTVAAPASAALLIDPTGGTSIGASFSDADEGGGIRSLGGTFSLYGTNLTRLYVQANGYLSAGSLGVAPDSSLPIIPSNQGMPIIAPLYDDLYYAPSLGDSVVEKIVSKAYYSVTYRIHSFPSRSTASAYDTFQVALFTGNTTVGNTTYQAGDIVFSYGVLNAAVDGSNFTVGVAKNGAISTAPTFSNSTGQFTTKANFLAGFDSSTQALLFRPNSGGTAYTASTTPLSAAVVPEANTAALLGLALPLVTLAQACARCNRIGTVVVVRRRKKEQS